MSGRHRSRPRRLSVAVISIGTRHGPDDYDYEVEGDSDVYGGGGVGRGTVRLMALRPQR